MTDAGQKRAAYTAGMEAYRADCHPFENPHAPIPPGDPLLARLWRAGWHAARRADEKGTMA